jgi:hypothetical protein
VSRRVLAAVGLVVAAWSALGIAAPASRGGHVTADEPQYLLTAISLGEDRSLDVSDELAARRYEPFHRAPLSRQTEARADGREVSPHDPLLPALLAVPMLAAGWVGAKVALALMAGALAVAMMWIAVVRFEVSTRVAVFAVLAFSAAAPLAVYGTQVYPELPAALAVTLAIAAITGRLDRRGLALAGACVVALPWLAVKYVPVALALAVCTLARRRSLAFALGLVAAGAVFAAAHLQWYGGLTPYASGDHFVDGEFTAVGTRPDYLGRSIRLVGLLFDRDFGLAAWQPAFLLAVPAAAALVRRRPAGWWVLTAPLAAGWLTATFVALTMHGWWWPGRQTVVVLPCVVLAVAWWAGTQPAVERVLVALGVLGASIYAWVVAQAAFGNLTLVVGFESTTHPLARAWRAVLPDYRDLTPRDWALHVSWLLAIAVTAAVVAWQPRLELFRTHVRGAMTE